MIPTSIFIYLLNKAVKNFCNKYREREKKTYIFVAKTHIEKVYTHTHTPTEREHLFGRALVAAHADDDTEIEMTMKAKV